MGETLWQRLFRGARRLRQQPHWEHFAGPGWKRGLIEEMVSLTQALHRRRRFHKDLYLCHFYIAEADTEQVPADWSGRVRLIDLHRLGHHPWTGAWWRAKDLAQLLYSSD